MAPSPVPLVGGISEWPSTAEQWGLITRGYPDADIEKIAGGNALAFFRHIMG
jgi:microsomal dipeptidase-like Zn-dependent dipeptidase